MRLVPVLIAGGGPVGMTLACELSRRGIECMLVERNATTTRYPKMDITNARSMELFRLLADIAAKACMAKTDFGIGLQGPSRSRVLFASRASGARGHIIV